MRDEPIWVAGKRERETEVAGLAAYVRETAARVRAREQAANDADDAKDAAAEEPWEGEDGGT